MNDSIILKVGVHTLIPYYINMEEVQKMFLGGINKIWRGGGGHEKNKKICGGHPFLHCGSFQIDKVWLKWTQSRKICTVPGKQNYLLKPWFGQFHLGLNSVATELIIRLIMA